MQHNDIKRQERDWMGQMIIKRKGIEIESKNVEKIGKVTCFRAKALSVSQDTGSYNFIKN